MATHGLGDRFRLRAGGNELEFCASRIAELNHGDTVHDRARRIGDASSLGCSDKILDGIDRRIGGDAYAEIIFGNSAEEVEAVPCIRDLHDMRKNQQAADIDEAERITVGFTGREFGKAGQSGAAEYVLNLNRNSKLAACNARNAARYRIGRTAWADRDDDGDGAGRPSLGIGAFSPDHEAGQQTGAADENVPALHRLLLGSLCVTFMRRLTC